MSEADDWDHERNWVYGGRVLNGPHKGEVFWHEAPSCTAAPPPPTLPAPITGEYSEPPHRPEPHSRYSWVKMNFSQPPRLEGYWVLEGTDEDQTIRLVMQV